MYFAPEDEDERTFEEVYSDAYQKIREAEVVEEADAEDQILINAEFDEREAAFIRMEILNSSSEMMQNEDIDSAAYFSLLTLTRSITGKVEQIDDEVNQFSEKWREDADFDELDDEEKEQRGREIHESGERVRDLLTATELFSDVIVFYMIVGSLMERYTQQLMQEEVVAEDFEDGDEAQNWIDEMSQARREKILKLTGVLSPEFTSEMGDVRETRNKLAHQLEHQQRLETLDDIEGEVIHAVEVLDSLYREFNEVGLMSVD